MQTGISDTKKYIISKTSLAVLPEITPELIELCNKFKFKFILPENLNNKNQSLDDITLNEEDVEGEDDDDEMRSCCFAS